MTLTFEDLRVLRTAETIADEVWREVIKWEPFARDEAELPIFDETELTWIETYPGPVPKFLFDNQQNI